MRSRRKCLSIWPKPCGAVDEEPQVRTVIVAGAGPMFSAGIDVMSLAESQGAVGELNPALVAAFCREFAARPRRYRSHRGAGHRCAARPGVGNGDGVGAVIRSARGGR